MTTKSPQDDMPIVSFDAKLYVVNRSTILRLPEDASEKLSSRGQVAAVGTIEGVEFQTVMEPDGRWGHWFKVDSKLQKAIGKSAGDTVSVTIRQTKDWPEPEIPDDFAKTLLKAPDAVRNLWIKITPMARWEWVRWVNATSNTETRKRRIEVSISKLQSSKRRPCCFNLAACTDPDLSKNGRLIDS